jgi:6-phosphogluconolactonase
VSSFELVRFSSPEELARAAASAWLDQLRAVSNAKRPYCVALSGGRIAGRFFEVVASQAQGQGALFAPAHFFWGDERCVPPDDAESNYRLADESMLRPLSIPANQVHRVRGEDSPGQAASQAEAELRRFAAPDPRGQPVLDLVFLGMGEEGHVASLFPGESAEEISSPAVFRHVVGIKPPPNRITLGYAAIAAAREVWLLASGSGKAAALSEAIAGTGRTPLCRVLQSRQQTRIFTDLPVG